MFTDSHAHIYEPYYEDLDLVVNESNENDVNRIIICGCNAEENEKVLKIINNYNTIFGAIGIHPETVLDYKPIDLEVIEKNLNNNKIVAIGEIGLDYYYSKDNKDEQIELFESQLEIAERNNLPVIIHSREATLDTINILKKHNCKGIIHSFSGSYETAIEYIKMGYLIGINGVITFKNSKIFEVIKRLPLESIVLETDSPYLTPVPYRGRKNSPKYIFDIAKYVSNLFEVDMESLAKITNDNLNRVFDKLK